MSTRPLVAAEPREIVGKGVSGLRRAGILPAVVYGHGHASQPIQIDAHEFDVLRRHVGRNDILDLQVGAGKATPVLVHGIHEHPVRRKPIHVDFFVVKMTEEMTVDVPIVHQGVAPVADKQGGTLLHMRESVQVRALPADLPSAVELDVSGLESFDAVLYVRDIVIPERAHLVTDPDEVVVRVQAPRVEEAVAAAPEVAEGAEVAAGAEAGTSEASGAEQGA